MTFTHDVEHSLATIVDIVNTDPACGGDELLPGLADLEGFVATHQISETGRLTSEDLEGVRALRAPLRAIFEAEDAEAAAELVHRVMGGARMCPRLTDHDGYDWHLHYFAPGASLTEHRAVDGGMALAHVVLSRNRSQRDCDSRTCGNRLHVAAYRERRRAALAG